MTFSHLSLSPLLLHYASCYILYPLIGPSLIDDTLASYSSPVFWKCLQCVRKCRNLSLDDLTLRQYIGTSPTVTYNGDPAKGVKLEGIILPNCGVSTNYWSWWRIRQDWKLFEVDYKSEGWVEQRLEVRLWVNLVVVELEAKCVDVFSRGGVGLG